MKKWPSSKTTFRLRMTSEGRGRGKLLFFVTEDWYFVSHRLSLAEAALAAGYEVCVVTQIGEHGERIRGVGLKLISFDNARSGLNIFKEIRTLFRLILLYRRERPDIVHHVAMKPVMYGSIAARFVQIPHVVNALTGMGWLFTSRSKMARFLMPFVCLCQRFLLRAGITLVQNPDDATLLVQIGVPKRRIRYVAGSGVDLEQFRPWPEPNGIPAVLLPARLLWDKGVAEFVTAARVIRGKGVPARFLLAGNPDLANPSAISSQQIEAWVSEGVVEHLGWVDDMPRLLAACHIVCLPSYREGLPKSLIEAAAAARPIVTTDVPGCREVVREAVNGLLVPPRDADALSVALETLLADAQLRRRMGAKGRVLAEQKFCLQAVIRQTLALYEERFP